MTLFVHYSRNGGSVTYSISELYVMIFAMGLSAAASYLILSSLKKRSLNRKQRRSLPKLGRGRLQSRGGDLLNELEASRILLQCIKDGGVGYQVTDPFLAQLIKRAIAEGFKYNSIIISQRFVRYVALRIAYSDKLPMLVKVYDVLFFVDNSSRFVVRILMSALIGLGGSVAAVAGATLANVVPATIFLILASFELSQDCGVPCDQYIHELIRSDNGKIEVLVERESDALIITSNEQAKDVEIYTPETDVLPLKEDGTTRKMRPYTRSKRPAKQVNYPDKVKEWNKEANQLEKLHPLPETDEAPYVPPRECRVAIDDAIGME